MKKILILGGFGFMGKNLNKVLKPEYLLYNESTRTGCDITNINILKEKIKDINPDIVINAAANVGSIAYVSKYAADVVHDNTLMYVNLYNAIKDVNPKIKVINPISNCSYPGIIDIQHEKNWWEGPVHESVEAYGSPKKISYIISKCYEKQYGIKTINLIVPNSYGPDDHLNEEKTHAMNGIVMRMIKAKKSNQKIFTVWGSGTPIREWIYMPDAANLIKEIIDNDIYNLPNPINIGQQEGISINESVEMIKQILDYDVEIQHDLTKQDGAPVKILGNELFKDWFPNFKFTDYDVGIKETINYYGALL
jgi:GDP-L-fucose synthase